MAAHVPQLNDSPKGVGRGGILWYELSHLQPSSNRGSHFESSLSPSCPFVSLFLHPPDHPFLTFRHVMTSMLTAESFQLNGGWSLVLHWMSLFCLLEVEFIFILILQGRCIGKVLIIRNLRRSRGIVLFFTETRCVSRKFET